MDHQNLHQFIASVPGTFGQRMSRQMATNMIMAGNADYAGALIDLVGVRVLPALVAARVSPAVLRTAIEHAVIYAYRELPALITKAGGRATFAAWCRQAGFTPPETLPPIVSLYRGSMGVAPAVAATGLHWSLSFDAAAHYACRFADAALTGSVVLYARVPRDGIAAFIAGTAHQEVVPTEAPTAFEIITDKDRIGDAAVREAHRCQALKAQGWTDTDTHGEAERIARAARARMASAGVALGTAVVA